MDKFSALLIIFLISIIINMGTIVNTNKALNGSRDEVYKKRPGFKHRIPTSSGYSAAQIREAYMYNSVCNTDVIQTESKVKTGECTAVASVLTLPVLSAEIKTGPVSKVSPKDPVEVTAA